MVLQQWHGFDTGARSATAGLTPVAVADEFKLKRGLERFARS